MLEIYLLSSQIIRQLSFASLHSLDLSDNSSKFVIAHSLSFKLRPIPIDYSVTHVTLFILNLVHTTIIGFLLVQNMNGLRIQTLIWRFTIQLKYAGVSQEIRASGLMPEWWLDRSVCVQMLGLKKPVQGAIRFHSLTWWRCINPRQVEVAGALRQLAIRAEHLRTLLLSCKIWGIRMGRLHCSARCVTRAVVRFECWRVCAEIGWLTCFHCNG